MKYFCNIVLAFFLFYNSSIVAEEDKTQRKIFETFEHWLSKRIDDLQSHSVIIDTAKGPIEYKRFGSGPVVLCLHGGPGGYDQSFLIGSHLISKHFTVIGVSRPGYLQTPLSVGQTIEEQADAMIALLDALEIDQAAVLGFSAGGPVAFQMALRHPDRVWGLVLESIGSQASDSSFYKLISEAIKFGELADFGSYLFFLSLRYQWHNTAKTILSLDNHLSSSALSHRINFVFDHKRQSRFLKKLMYSIIPVTPRIEGLQNDIKNVNPWSSFPYETIVTPTIIIQAKADSNGSFSEAIDAAQRIPGAQFFPVNGSGHFLWLGKNTAEWEKKLVRFLRTHKP